MLVMNREGPYLVLVGTPPGASFLGAPPRPEGGTEDLRRDLEPIPDSLDADFLVSRAGLPAEEMPVPCNSVPVAEAGFASTHFRGKSTHRRRTLPLRS